MQERSCERQMGAKMAASPDSRDCTNLWDRSKLIMSCCRCNRNGTCSGCKCAKSAQKCTNCLPMKLNNCNNTQPFTNQPKVDGSQSGLESTSSLTIYILNSPPISRDSEEVEFPMGNISNNRHAKMHERLECLESLPEPELPNFVWGSDLPGSVFCDRVSRV